MKKFMTVEMLVEALKEFPRNVRVFETYDGGSGAMDFVRLKKVIPVNGYPALIFDNEVVEP